MTEAGGAACAQDAAVTRSIIKKYKKPIWHRFIGACKDYALVNAGDRVAVCISGGKDSFLLAKCIQHLQRVSDVPFEAEYLCMDPGYLPENRALIERNAAALGVTLTGSVSAAGYNESETYLLGRLVHGEARGEPYVGKVAVAAVVLNRVKSPSFPNTISGVIYQSGAFDAVADGQINLTPDEDSLRAARDALNGWDPTGGCLYYYNPATATNGWIWSRTVQLSIGKHNFAI